jgi:hypothetical protein
MGNSNWSGGRYWEPTEDVDIPAATLALSDSIRDQVLGKFANVGARDTALAALPVGERAGCIAYVAGSGWTAYDGATWYDLANVKHGRVDATVEGNGNARIDASRCFFNGVAPSDVQVTSAMGPTFTFAHTLNDGAGVLIRGYDHGNNAYVAAGAAVAFNFLAVK